MYDDTKKKETTKVSVYKFPTKDDEKRAWVNALPNMVKVEDVTENVVICEKHWPEGFETTTKKGHTRPKYPPSVFSVPASCAPQTSNAPRDIKSRKVDSESRSEAQKKEERERDKIKNWKSLVNFCKKLPLLFTQNQDSIQLIRLEETQPEVLFSISISNDFKVCCYKKGVKVPMREILTAFSAKLEFYSEINEMITKLTEYTIDINSYLSKFSNELKELTNFDIEGSKGKRIDFLADQLHLNTYELQGIRYSSDTITQALNLFLRSRNSYNSLRETLLLPHPDTLKSLFGKLGSPGSIKECSNVVSGVFSNLTDMQKHCKIIFDEIHIKPGVQYQGGHILGFSEDQPEKPARTILAIMIGPLMGGPPFVARLIPIYSLKQDFLYEQSMQMIS